MLLMNSVLSIILVLQFLIGNAYYQKAIIDLAEEFQGENNIA